MNMATTGALHWQPTDEFRKTAELTRFIGWLRETKNLHFDDYTALHSWSVADVGRFWEHVWDFFEVESSTPRGPGLASAAMPGARWFPTARLNYARRLVQAGADDAIAIDHYSELREPGTVTWGELRDGVRNLAHTLLQLGVAPGDRVAAYMPNVPEALTAMVATTGIGALWSSCSPDFGVSSVLDRFRQIAPKVLIAVDGYRYGGKDFDRRDAVRQLKESLPSVEHIVHLPYLFNDAEDTGGDGALTWAAATAPRPAGAPDPLAADFAFDHPLWIVYSSGTTGLPKGMVHGHGSMLLEHLKLHAFHMNHGSDSKLFFYTTTGWVMFNLLVAALITGTSIVQYDGNPAYPDMKALWRMVERSKVTSFGTSPTFVNTLAQNNVCPNDEFDLSSLRSAVCTGSPLTPESFAWFYDKVKTDLWVSSLSGGTDVATGFVGGVPIAPVHSGEIQGHCLGVDVRSFDDNGKGVIEAEGELVITQPMPTMPLYFWNDETGQRYHESYFDTYPGVWRHGDLIRITNRGSSIISGRSDSTLNRHGVRIGTSEIYRSVESLDEVVDSMIVHLDGNDDVAARLPLFVVLKEGVSLDDALVDRIRSHIRQERSPRHVPDSVHQVPMIPYTLTGKKMEVPTKKILLGARPEDVANADAMANPEAIAQFEALAGHFR
ncbi:MAG: acetoacetate--CoA ligase [Chromatiales bacterium]|jgi:acetoacetyl-CoA synthetase|nr:acetoacetate--CoA ligase [Chromatiales bacterium]